MVWAACVASSSLSTQSSRQMPSIRLRLGLSTLDEKDSNTIGAVVADLRERGEHRSEVDGSRAQVPSMVLADMEVPEALPARQHGRVRVGLLDVHVVRVEVDDDVGPVHLVHERECLASRVENVAFVPVHDLEPEGDAEIRRMVGNLLDHRDAVADPRRCGRIHVLLHGAVDDAAHIGSTDAGGNLDGLVQQSGSLGNAGRVLATDVGAGIESERGGGLELARLERRTSFVHGERVGVHEGEFDEVESGRAGFLHRGPDAGGAEFAGPDQPMTPDLHSASPRRSTRQPRLAALQVVDGMKVPNGVATCQVVVATCQSAAQE